ncbi:MAG: ACT domain-containing protein [Actinomycetaceae bacterium]|nr:ACT domain-containing protein [Actinomycetaceae bacterium]
MSTPITDLAQILASLHVRRRGNYVYAVLPQVPDGVDVLATVREAEGLTVILAADDAVRLGVDASVVMACLTLDVHSSLEAVGLTAAVASALVAEDIPCNMVAGYYHDHVLVPVGMAQRAVEVIERLGG